MTDRARDKQNHPGRSSTGRRVMHFALVHVALDGRIFYREALTLRELGYEVVLCGIHGRDELIRGVRVMGMKKVQCRFLRAATSWYRALKVIAANPADIYHFHEPELLPAAVLAKTFLNKHVVFDAHEDVTLLMLSDWVPNWLKRPMVALARSWDRSFAPRVDAVIVPTRRLKQRYQQIAQRVECYHNFPAPDFLRARDAGWLPFENRRKEVIHLGTLSMPRLRFLIELAERFLDRHQGWYWTFVGLHPERFEWFRTNIAGKFGERMTGVGKVPHMEVPRRCCQARIGINYHQLETRQIQVAIPVKVFEYLACGLGVVTTRVPLLVELIEDCPSVRLSDATSDALLQELDELANTEEDKSGQLSETAREFVDKRFNCIPEARRLASVYESILQQG